MWNQTKPPSVRDLAARIASQQSETAAELARIRSEQRELQAALEAEAHARLDALAALHDRLTTQVDDLLDRLELASTALNAATGRIDGLSKEVGIWITRVDVAGDRLDDYRDQIGDLQKRVGDLEGELQPEAPAFEAPAPDAPAPDGVLSPEDGPLLRTRMAFYDPVIEPPADGAATTPVDLGAPADDPPLGIAPAFPEGGDALNNGAAHG